MDMKEACHGRRCSSADLWRTAGEILAVALVAGALPRVAAAQASSGPLSDYTTHVVATHYLRGDSYETHHYFKGLRDGVLQGLVFRTSAGGAALIEVEWAIGADVYERLPDWQKEYWHPLRPAVDAGRVQLPDLPEAEEREMLRTVAGLYAQTINLAGVSGDELPTGLEGVATVTHLTRAELLRALHGGN